MHPRYVHRARHRQPAELPSKMAHFGNPAQPFSDEAYRRLRELVHGRRVSVQMFSKDRFGRIVGMAYVRKFPWVRRTNVSEAMLKSGLAQVYRQAGAEYGDSFDTFERLEREARSRGLGLWSQAEQDRESPAMYKRRVRAKD